MATKHFTITENQEAWERYSTDFLKGLEGDELAKKKVSLAQYGCSVRAFENAVKKPFRSITAEDMEAFAEQTGKKGKFAHVNGFLLACLTNGYIKNTNTDFLICLLPDAYKVLGRMIAENA